jgi:hypothetical protein
MTLRLAFVGAALLTLSLAWPGRATAAPRVAVVLSAGTLIDQPGRAATAGDGRRDITAEASKAAGEAGAEIVPTEQLTGDLPGCHSSDCYVRIGQATSATHVLIIDGRFAEDGYKLKVELWDARTGARIDGDGRDCVSCAVPDFLQAIHDRTADLCTRVFRGLTVATAAPGTGIPASPAPTPGAEEPPSWKRALPWALIGAGAGIGAYGGFLLWRDTRCVDSSDKPGGHCVRVYDTKPQGIVFGSVGLAGVAAGLILMAVGYPDAAEHPRVSLLLGPSELGVAGHF